MNKRICTALAAVLATACAIASVPLKWTVETSTVNPRSFKAFHGETLDLSATLNSYGSGLDLSGKTANIYWRTTSMPSDVYWIGPASVTGNVMRATFTPSMDPGESRLIGFLGIQGEIYRAAFTLRLLAAPGFSPGTVNLPTKELDFSTVEVLHAPYYTKSETTDAITNTVTKSFVESLGISGGSDGVDEDAVKGIVKDMLENPSGNVTVTMDKDEVQKKIVFKDVGAPFFTIDGTRDDGSVVASGPLVIDSNGQLVIESGAVIFTEGDRTLAEYGLSSAVANITNGIPTIVTNVSRAVQGTIYDNSLGVTWRMVMDDGHLYTIAVTNANTTVIGGAR